MKHSICSSLHQPGLLSSLVPRTKQKDRGWNMNPEVRDENGIFRKSNVLLNMFFLSYFLSTLQKNANPGHPVSNSKLG